MTGPRVRSYRSRGDDVPTIPKLTRDADEAPSDPAARSVAIEDMLLNLHARARAALADAHAGVRRRAADLAAVEEALQSGALRAELETRYDRYRGSAIVRPPEDSGPALTAEEQRTAAREWVRQEIVALLLREGDAVGAALEVATYNTHDQRRAFGRRLRSVRQVRDEERRARRQRSQEAGRVGWTESQRQRAEVAAMRQTRIAELVSRVERMEQRTGHTAAACCRTVVQQTGVELTPKSLQNHVSLARQKRKRPRPGG